MRSVARLSSLLVVLFAVGCGGSTNSGGSTSPDSGNGGSAGTVADSGTGGSAGTISDSGTGGSAGSAGTGGSAGSAGTGGSAGSAGSGGSAGAAVDAGNIITGRACSSDAECGAGYMCNTEAPGGYCMEGAPGGPTACNDPAAPCTAPGSTCSPLPYHQISGVCLRTCTSAADCRQNQICAVVQLFPGDPSSPTSPTKVCWYACQPGMNQTCNDNPLISSVHGTCNADGTCTCNAGIAKNPQTGRCL